MWVIEQYQGNKLHFWRGANVRRENVWTDAFSDAVTFSDERSANRVLFDLCDGIGRTVEHAMVEA